jgi:zinc protease
MVAQVVPGIPIDSPDYAALFMADRVFGGMSASRLGRNIRQGKGIAYYAASQLSHYPGLGLWVAFSPVQTDQTAVAMREFQQERLALAGGRPITAEELDQARNSVIRALPEYYESLWSTTEQIARTWAWGLPMSALQTIPENLAAVTLEQVNAAARKYAQPERAFFVLIGDREKIEPQIREAGLGEIVAVQ